MVSVPLSNLVAVMSRSEARTRAYAQRHGIPRDYTSVEELLSDSEVDAVYVVTPPNSHAEFTKRAASAGKHVLYEKPLAMNLRECREMIAACRDNGAPAVAQVFWRTATPVDELDIGGTEGRLFVRDLKKGELVMTTKQGVSQQQLPRHPITHYGLVEDFVQSLSNGKPNCLPGEDGMRASLMVEAALLFAKERRVVKVTDMGG